MRERLAFTDFSRSTRLPRRDKVLLGLYRASLTVASSRPGHLSKALLAAWCRSHSKPPDRRVGAADEDVASANSRSWLWALRVED